MLHLHPVTIPSTVSDTIGLEGGAKFEDADSIDGSMTDGMEHIFNSSTQLRYGRDLRLNEVIFGTLHAVHDGYFISSKFVRTSLFWFVYASDIYI